MKRVNSYSPLASSVHRVPGDQLHVDHPRIRDPEEVLRLGLGRTLGRVSVAGALDRDRVHLEAIVLGWLDGARCDDECVT